MSIILIFEFWWPKLYTKRSVLCPIIATKRLGFCCCCCCFSFVNVTILIYIYIYIYIYLYVYFKISILLRPWCGGLWYFIMPLQLNSYSLSGRTSRSNEIGCYNDRNALKFDRHLGNAAAEVSVKFKSNWKSLNPNLAAWRLREILVNKCPGGDGNMVQLMSKNTDKSVRNCYENWFKLDFLRKWFKSMHHLLDGRWAWLFCVIRFFKTIRALTEKGGFHNNDIEVFQEGRTLSGLTIVWFPNATPPECCLWF